MSVLALHGFAQSPEQWRRFFPSGACPWLGGHGSAPLLPGGFEAEVKRLEALALSLPQPRRLVGYSQGARLGLGLLVKAPELFERACLVAVNPGLETELERSQRQKWELDLAQKLETQGLDAFFDYWEALPLFASQRAFPAARLEQRQARRVHQAAPLARALVELGLGAMPNYWPELGSVRVAVDLVVGAEDEKFVPIAERAQKGLPGSKLHKIQGAGHNPLLEAPLELREWLEETGYL